MAKLVIATGNEGKVREIKAILGDFYDEIKSLKDAGIDVDVVEDGATFHENAAKKAMEISKLVEGDVLADDSGLCVEALGGAPGIYSARFSAEGGDAANNRRLLAELEEKTDRRAKFVCAVVLARGGEEVLYAEGEAPGVILEAPRGEGGFGYDPLFLDEESRLTFAELPAETKNRISHRAKALAKLRELVSGK